MFRINSCSFSLIYPVIPSYLIEAVLDKVQLPVFILLNTDFLETSTSDGLLETCRSVHALPQDETNSPRNGRSTEFTTCSAPPLPTN